LHPLQDEHAIDAEATAKAAALVEAHQYIRQFRDRIVVSKVGGSIMDEPDSLRSLLADVCFLQAVGMRPILVHGGGKGITAAMRDAGLEAQFVQGRRYTDARTLAIVEHVLIDQVNRPMVDMIRELGHAAMSLHSLGSCVVFGRRLFLEDEGRRLDIGLVGEVTDVNAELLRSLAAAGQVPVIAPVGLDPSGGKLNINADSVAGRVAAAVRAEKLVLVSDTHGIRTGEGDDTLARSLSREVIQSLIDRGVIGSGMLPKVEAALVALEAGVGKTHIIDGRIRHALLLEIYTDRGIGTEIVLD